MHSRAVHSSLALCGNNGPLHSLWAQDCQQEPEFSLHIERQERKGGEEKKGVGETEGQTEYSGKKEERETTLKEEAKKKREALGDPMSSLGWEK